MKYFRLLATVIALYSSCSSGLDPKQVGEVLQPLVNQSQPLNKRYMGIWAGIITYNSEMLAGEHPFGRVDKDLAVYDEELTKLKNAFTTLPVEPQSKTWIQKKLAHMVEIDQHMRRFTNVIYKHSYNEVERQYFYSQFGKRFRRIDHRNTRELKELLMPRTWFKISEFGAESDDNAWLLTQHADLDPEFQKHVLKILEGLYPIKETNPRNYAYLYDRVAASWIDPSKRKPQRFGTQGSCIAPGKWEPIAIEDPKNVDVRRATVGLTPLAEYILQFQTICE